MYKTTEGKCSPLNYFYKKINIFLCFFRLAAKNDNLCLDDLQQSEEPFNLGVYSCHKSTVTRSQMFSLTNEGVLRNEVACASVQKR